MTILDSKLEAYVHDHTRPRGALFEELREVTYASMAHAHMQVGRVEGALLTLLCRLKGARRAIEIGTFTGYSALALAEGLPEDGSLITCDIDPEATRIAQQFWARSPHGRKIELRLGDARTTLAALPEEPTFDLAFIDADKGRYLDYYEALLPRLHRGGLIIADNTLWSGRVLDPTSGDDHAIVAFNKRVTADERVDNVLLSVRDGMMLAYKR